MANNNTNAAKAGKKSLLASLNEQITPIIALVGLITAIFTGYFWMENRYARAEAVENLQQRFELKLKEDTLAQVQERIWKLKDRLDRQPNDTTAKEQLRELEVQKSKLDREIDVLRKPVKR
jgi:hypothetical protein